MQLEYLLFDFSDEESGNGSFDAMASVASVSAHHVAAMNAEVQAVLAWSAAAFGVAAALDDGGEWDYELNQSEDGLLTTLTLTLSGTPAFCKAFSAAFPNS
ncbi:hypothetical protein [Caenimonas sp. SL110]|uniref:hypothetical protein n=1 Tax=Caenimonas sp. SL110 TaxID=1450524 RepID=UPI0006548EA3|nr:hypothetical protein [Caenimonas sp. SL110]